MAGGLIMKPGRKFTSVFVGANGGWAQDKIQEVGKSQNRTNPVNTPGGGVAH